MTNKVIVLARYSIQNQRGQSEWSISLPLLFTQKHIHVHAHLYERIKMDRHRVLAHFYDVILIYIDTPTAGNRGALLKLNGTSFSGCEIFDTGQIVLSSFILANPRHRSERLSYFADYYTAWHCIIRESVTSQSGIISNWAITRMRTRDRNIDSASALGIRVH